MDKLAVLVIPEDDIVTVFARLRLLPGCELLLKEGLYLHAHAKLVQTMSAVALVRQQAEVRSQRHVSQKAAGNLTALRSATANARARLNDGIELRFKTTDVVEQLGAVGVVQRRLGVSFDTKFSAQACDAADNFVDVVMKEWINDLKEFGSAMSKWMVQGIRTKLGSILENANEGNTQNKN